MYDQQKAALVQKQLDSCRRFYTILACDRHTDIQTVIWWQYQHHVVKCKDVRTNATFCHTVPISQCFSSSCFITRVKEQYNTDLQVHLLLLFHLLLLLHLQYRKLSFSIYYQHSNRLNVSKWNKNRPSSYKLKSRSVDNIHHLFTRRNAQIKHKQT